MEAPPRPIARAIRGPPRPVPTAPERPKVMGGTGANIVKEGPKTGVREAATPEVTRDGRFREGPTAGVIASPTKRLLIAVAVPPLAEMAAMAVEAP